MSEITKLFKFFEDDDCVVCFHAAHKGEVCEIMQIFPAEGYEESYYALMCGCSEYKTEEDRGKISVIIGND